MIKVCGIILLCLVFIIFIYLYYMSIPKHNREFYISGKHDGGFFSIMLSLLGGIAYGLDKKAGAITIYNKDKKNQYTDKGQSLSDTYLSQTHFKLRKDYKPVSKLYKKIQSGNALFNTIPLQKYYTGYLWGKHRKIFPVKSNIPLKKLGDIAKEYIQWDKDIINKMNDWYTQNKKGDEHQLSVHYRGTDTVLHYPYKKIPYQLYYDYIDKYIETHPSAGIFVATDEKDFLDEVTRRYENVFNYYTPKVRKKVTKENPGFQLIKDGVKKYDVAEGVIIDMLLLAKGDTLIKGRSCVSDFSLITNPSLACYVVFGEDEIYYKEGGENEKFNKI
jgi:hypothetical protein